MILEKPCLPLPLKITAASNRKLNFQKLLWTAFLLLFLGEGLASAQPTSDSDTRALSLPFPSVSHHYDSFALEANPASLAYLRSYSLHYLAEGQFADENGMGHGLFLAIPVIDGLALGAGLQFIDPPGADNFWSKYTLSVGAGITRWLAVGASWHGFGSDNNQMLDEINSFDLGMTIRPFSFLSVGLSIRDVNTPNWGEESIDRTFALGTTVHLLNGRIDLETVLSYRSEPELSTSLIVEPLSGVRLWGGLETEFSEISSIRAGLELNLDYIGLGFEISLDKSEDYKPGSFLGYLRVSGERHRPMVDYDGFWVRYTLFDDLPERGTEGILGPDKKSHLDFLLELEKIASDERINGVFINLRQPGISLAGLYEIRQELLAIRRAGKKVVIYLNGGKLPDVYLASAADLVFLNPAASLFMGGLRTELTYVTETLAKLGIKGEFVRMAEFKGFPEQFERINPSDPVKQMMELYLDDAFSLLIEEITSERTMDRDSLITIINNSPVTPPEAKATGLVDRVLYQDEVPEALRELLGYIPVMSDGYPKPSLHNDDWSIKPIIAVVYVDGDIITGESSTNPITGEMSGSDTFRKIMQIAREDSRVKAVVIRVSSPGGSAHASDLMNRQVILTKKRKPVIVSMGSVAASGGYYVSANASAIYATPYTMTGSIGIFAGKADLSELFAMIGLHRHTISRGERTDLFTFNRAWSDEERAAMMAEITYLYELFVKQVAEGRKLTPEEVDGVARGRVWSGTQAADRGLVDKLAGLSVAIKDARLMAGLDPDEDVLVLSLPQQSVMARLSAEIGLSSEKSEEPGPLSAILSELGVKLPVFLVYGAGEPMMRLEYDVIVR